MADAPAQRRDSFLYAETAAIVIIVVLTVMVIDILSTRLRKALI